MLAIMSDMLPGLERREPKGITPAMWVAGAFAAVVLVGGVALFLTQKDDGYDSNTSYEAIAQCEAAIKDRLKAPSTAEFQSTATGGGTWTVTGTVDAENSFGAMMRSSYQCTVKIDNAEDTAQVRVDRFE